MSFLPSLKQAVYIVLILGIIAAIGVQIYYNSVSDSEDLSAPVNPVEEKVACLGKPIFVDYPYEGAYLVPVACMVQCEEKTDQRFIYYTNGEATQCEENLGCWDTGEDRDITCIPPADVEKFREEGDKKQE